MNLLRSAILFLLVFVALAHADSVAYEPEPAGPPLPTATSAAEIVERFVAANRLQQDRLRDLTMEVEIRGRRPKLKTEATVHAVRQVAPSGEISYETLGSSGDSWIRKEVIARYMAEEVDASKKLVTGDGKLKSIGINQDNYKFKYKGLGKLNGRQLYVFEITPKEKRLGLFKGEVWIDTETFQTIRESGTFLKYPSPIIKKIEFVRQYDLRDGVALPAEVSSRLDVHLYGKADLDIHYSNVTNILAAQSRVCALGW